MALSSKRSALLALIVSLSAGPLAAQDIGPALDPAQLGTSMAANSAAQRLLQRHYAEQGMIGGGAPRPMRGGPIRGGPGMTPPPPIAASGFRYAVSIDRRKHNIAQFVAKSRRADPEGAAKMQQLFASMDVFAELQRHLDPVGLRIDNVADAQAVWWLDAWMAAHGDAGTPSRAQAQAVRAQAAQALAGTPGFAGAGDAVKQEMAEAYLIHSLLIDTYVDQAKGNPALMRRVAAAVRQGAQQTGLDLDSMELTPRGFVPAR